MKIKIKAVICCLVLTLCLCGCSVYNEADMQYTVAALGFEGGDEITVYAEIITVNPESTEQETGNLIASASGETVGDAICELSHKLSKPLFLSHCGLICLGYSLKSEQLQNIFDYCYENEEINYSVYFIASPTPNELLSLESISEMATGYDIMGIIRQTSKAECVDFNNRYYKIESVRLGVQDMFSLPVFEVEGENTVLKGSIIYTDCEIRAILDNSDSYFYYLLRGLSEKGSVTIGGKKVKIKSLSDNFDCSYRNTTLNINLDFTLDYEGDSDVYSALLSGCENLIEKSQTEYKADIFGFGARIHKQHQKIWEKIKEDYGNIYISSDITLNFKGSGQNEN